MRLSTAAMGSEMGTGLLLHKALIEDCMSLTEISPAKSNGSKNPHMALAVLSVYHVNGTEVILDKVYATTRPSFPVILPTSSQILSTVTFRSGFFFLNQETLCFKEGSER